jgi:tetratricopeptide (TPR) repeat protein
LFRVSVFPCFCVLIFCVLVFCVSACAPKPAPIATGTPKHLDFVFPAVPDQTSPEIAAQIDRGWQFLQVDDFGAADREFNAVLKRQAKFYPAEAALGYSALARSNSKDAVERFDRALATQSAYVPALVGKGRALLDLDRNAEALSSFEAALAADPSMTDLRSRVDVLRVRAVQDTLARAKKAADAQRWDEARSAYEQAIAVSPDSAFLYRELAGVEQKSGQGAMALDHYRKAIELDPSDARSHAAIGAILESQNDVLGALAAYERARAADPNEVPEAVFTRIRTRAELAKLPPQYGAIGSAPTVSRADVAALIGYRLAALVGRAPQRQSIITDVRGNWAERWITPVVRSGLMDTLPNYQFDPAGRVRRGDLALTVTRALQLIAAEKPSLGQRWQGARVTINDVSAAHLSYPAVSMAVASGVMALTAGNFDLLRQVSGAEAMEIVGRLEALAR